jgi:hypothetical protein
MSPFHLVGDCDSSSLPSELNLHSRSSSQDCGNRFDFHPYDLDQLRIAEEKQRAIQFHQ